ncbi:MAG: hypothetical protein GY820_02275 [Gammaproteobacteria bacterium]|nr:hypothetical protein [Gammaproteobacteria bacterium]
MSYREVTNKLYQAEPQGESAQHDEARPDHCEMVNTEVVQRRIVSLSGVVRHSGVYLPKLFNDSGGTEPAKVRVNRVEISRRRELRLHSEERSEGSVTGDASEL